MFPLFRICLAALIWCTRSLCVILVGKIDHKSYERVCKTPLIAFFATFLYMCMADYQTWQTIKLSVLTLSKLATYLVKQFCLLPPYHLSQLFLNHLRRYRFNGEVCTMYLLELELFLEFIYFQISRNGCVCVCGCKFHESFSRITYWFWKNQKRKFSSRSMAFTSLYTDHSDSISQPYCHATNGVSDDGQLYLEKKINYGLLA